MFLTLIGFTPVRFSPDTSMVLQDYSEVCIINSYRYLCHNIKQPMSYHIVEFVLRHGLSWRPYTASLSLLLERLFSTDEVLNINHHGAMISLICTAT